MSDQKTAVVEMAGYSNSLKRLENKRANEIYELRKNQMQGKFKGLYLYNKFH